MRFHAVVFSAADWQSAPSLGQNHARVAGCGRWRRDMSRRRGSAGAGSQSAAAGGSPAVVGADAVPPGPPCSCSWYEYGSRDFAGRFGLDFSMAVVAVPFILYLVRFCSSKSCTRTSTSTSTSTSNNLRPTLAVSQLDFTIAVRGGGTFGYGTVRNFHRSSIVSSFHRPSTKHREARRPSALQGIAAVALGNTSFASYVRGHLVRHLRAWQAGGWQLHAELPGSRVAGVRSVPKTPFPKVSTIVRRRCFVEGA